MGDRHCGVRFSHSHRAKVEWQLLFQETSYGDLHSTDRRSVVQPLAFCARSGWLCCRIGNIWKFPYIAGENGGGAFVLIYLVCVAFVGAPIMISEVMLGRKGRASPINTMGTLAKQASASGRWGFVGWMGVLAGVLILSYYAVIAGWALNYVWLTASGTFDAASAQVATSTLSLIHI